MAPSSNNSTNGAHDGEFTFRQTKLNIPSKAYIGCPGKQPATGQRFVLSRRRDSPGAVEPLDHLPDQDIMAEYAMINFSTLPFCDQLMKYVMGEITKAQLIINVPVMTAFLSPANWEYLDQVKAKVEDDRAKQMEDSRRRGNDSSGAQVIASSDGKAEEEFDGSILIQEGSSVENAMLPVALIPAREKHRNKIWTTMIQTLLRLQEAQG